MTLSVYPSSIDERVENQALWADKEKEEERNTGSYLHTTLSFPSLRDRFLKALTISLLSLAPGSYSLQKNSRKASTFKGGGCKAEK